MTNAVPWNIDGVDFDAREAAKAAARRAGVSLGDWLNGVIAEQAASLGVGVDEINEDERLEAVAARLAKLSKRPAQNASPGTRRLGRNAGETTSRSAPPEEDLSDFKRARAVYDQADRRAPVAFDAELLLDRAVAAFDRRTRLANDRTSAALAKVSRRLGEIEDRLEQGVQQRGESPAQDLLSRLEARLEGIAHQGVPQEVGGRLGELDRKLTAIANRLEQTETKMSGGGRPDDFARIEAKLTRLSETIDHASRSQPQPVGPRRDPFARRSVADAVAEISRRQAALDQDARPAPAADASDDLRSELAALSTRLDEMRRDSATRDEQQFRTISEKLDTLGSQRPDIATLARIRAQTEETRNLLVAAVARPMPIENIEGQINALAQRIDAAAKLNPSAGALEQVDAQLAEIFAALERAAAEPALQLIEGRIELLGQKVEEALSNSPGSEQFDELTDRLDFVHRSLAARMEQPPVLDTAAFEGMMRDIVDKLAQPPRAAAGTPQLEDLLSRLADRLETPPPTSRLEELVRDLADKIDATVAPRADLHASDGLQDQIARLAHRLDETDVNAGAFGSLERSISDLFVGLEETRRAAIDAAETAAHDAVREFALASPAPGEETEHVTRELADLRALQDAADRQTHATLTAVHETLEKVVDRLAMLEDDIMDVRGAASGQISASGPAPFFAPPPQQRGAQEAVRVWDMPLAAQPDDGDFLIEPGSGFSPERRPMDPPVRKPSPPDPKPPAKPPSAPATPPVPPETGSTQSNFIAAARRTIQANAENAALASNRSAAAALDNALAEARSRARVAASALMDNPGKPEDRSYNSPPQRSGAIARASAFFANRKRPLVLGLAGVVVVLCALQLVRNQTPTDMATVNESVNSEPAATKLAEPQIPAPVVSGPAASAPSSSSDPSGASTPRADPSLSGGSSAATAMQKSSSIASPGVDLSPVGAIATSKPTSIAPPVLSMSPSSTALTALAVPSAAPAAPLAGASANGANSDVPALRDLAERGNAAAQFELGVRYAEGRGLPHDLKLAAQWLEKSAKQNIAPAEYRLGTLYEKGLGVTRDSTVAINWYRRAASAGNIRAMHNLAVMIAESSDAKPDYDEAAAWFRKAAEFGVRDSQYNLAILYARGLGVPKDLAQSYVWFSLAAMQGDQDAGGKRDEIASHLDPKQLDAAKTMVDVFKPQKAIVSANDVAPPPGGWNTLEPAPNAQVKAATGAKVTTL